jgi:hypothetical protein
MVTRRQILQAVGFFGARPLLPSVLTANTPVAESGLQFLADEARRDAHRGVFWPPYDRVAWSADAPDIHAAQDAYSRSYWREFERLRFERDDYDLL